MLVATIQLLDFLEDRTKVAQASSCCELVLHFLQLHFGHIFVFPGLLTDQIMGQGSGRVGSGRVGSGRIRPTQPVIFRKSPPPTRPMRFLMTSRPDPTRPHPRVTAHEEPCIFTAPRSVSSCRWLMTNLRVAYHFFEKMVDKLTIHETNRTNPNPDSRPIRAAQTLTLGRSDQTSNKWYALLDAFTVAPLDCSNVNPHNNKVNRHREVTFSLGFPCTITGEHS